MPARHRAVADHRDDPAPTSPARSRATAKPSPAEIEVEECAAPNGSYSLSLRLVKPRGRRPAQGADAVAPAGQDLVRIALVADVPDQPIFVWRVEDVVQRDRQLD
jgi:hypothetical protein